MYEYIDHFEIETKRPGEDWTHAANRYPKYEWQIWWPWYFLGLKLRQVILNEREAWTTCFETLCRGIRGLPESEEEVRLVTWLRRGKKLVHSGAMKPC